MVVSSAVAFPGRVGRVAAGLAAHGASLPRPRSRAEPGGVPCGRFG